MKTVRSFVLASASLWAIAAPAYAQDAGGNEGEGIVVTARRTEERLQDVPISIAVFSQQTLNDRNITTADDLAKQTPSLSSASRFGPESTNFAIRGFNQEGQTTPSVGVYFADVIGPRAQGGTSGGNGAGVGQFFDLQNVQVLRGPQGTLFGRNTTGGAVLLVPQRPTDRLEGYVEGSVGNYDMYRLQGVLNVPFGNDKGAIRLGVDHQNRDGYLRNRSGIGPSTFNDVNYISVRGSILANLTPNLENYAIFRYTKSDTNGPQVNILAANVGPNCTPAPGSVGTVARIGPLVCSQQLARATANGYGFYDVENDIPDAYQTIKYWSVINTTSWQVNDNFKIRNIASYQEFRQAQNGNAFGTNLRVPAIVNGAPSPDAGRPISYVNILTDVGRNNIEQYTFTDELQLQGNAFDNKLTYQIGGYYEYAGPFGDFQGTRSGISISCTDLLANQCSNPYGAGIVQNSLTRYSFENIGFYGQGTYNLTEKLAVTGGIRYTIDTVKAEGATRLILFPVANTPVFRCSRNTAIVANDPTACSIFSTQKSERPTWLIDVDYHVTPDALLYAKYSRGYRQGSTNVSNTIPVDWAPESVDAYEIGAKISFDGAVSGYFNLAAFYNTLKDQQVPASLVPLPGTTNSPAQAIINAGKSRIQGIEVDGLISPFTGLNLTVGYAFLDTKLVSANALPVPPPGYSINASAAVGEDLAYSPRHRLVLGARYTLPLPESAGRFSLGATYTYTSSQQSVYYIPAPGASPFSNPFGKLPSTQLLDLNVNWSKIAGSPVDVSLFMTNVTNEKYNVAIGNGYFTAGYEYGIRGQPRMFGARLRYSFGSD